MVLHPFVGLSPLLLFRNLFYTDSRTPSMGDKPVAGRYIQTGQHKHRINANTDIHASTGIRTHELSFRASEDSLCFRLRGYCDRPYL
jgi:hypothetical protein